MVCLKVPGVQRHDGRDRSAGVLNVRIKSFKAHTIVMSRKEFCCVIFCCYNIKYSDVNCGRKVTVGR